MKAMVLEKIQPITEHINPLRYVEIPAPLPKPGEVRLRVSTCGVCHTELDEIEGRTPPPRLPVIPGHQVVGTIDMIGPDVKTLHVGDRVGVAWIFSSCGKCQYCSSGQENLCSEFRATGRDIDGGYAQYMLVDQHFAFPIPPTFSDSQAAPLLCAGAIGYRSLRLAQFHAGGSLGLAGFGASAHLVLKLAQYLYPTAQFFVFSRSEQERSFALELGAHWTGAFGDIAPEPLHAIIDTTPAWKPVVESLRNLAPAGRLVINAIRKEQGDQDTLLGLDYSTHLWMEKEIKSVANVSRRDVSEFLELAAQIPIIPEFQEFSLEAANLALFELKNRQIRGSKVLRLS